MIASGVSSTHHHLYLKVSTHNNFTLYSVSVSDLNLKIIRYTLYGIKLIRIPKIVLVESSIGDLHLRCVLNAMVSKLTLVMNSIQLCKYIEKVPRWRLKFYELPVRCLSEFSHGNVYRTYFSTPYSRWYISLSIVSVFATLWCRCCPSADGIILEDLRWTADSAYISI